MGQDVCYAPSDHDVPDAQNAERVFRARNVFPPKTPFIQVASCLLIASNSTALVPFVAMPLATVVASQLPNSTGCVAKL